MSVIKVTGMTCSGCVRSVERAIKSVDPQAQVEVALQSGTARIESSQPTASFVAALEKAGYGASEA